MTRSPDRDDRAVILRLAEGGTSIRKIAGIVRWSRPTVAKVLQEQGFDPNTKRVATGSPEGGGVGDADPIFDYEAAMAQAGASAAEAWQRWQRGEDRPTYGTPWNIVQVDHPEA